MVRAIPLDDNTNKARPADLGTGTPSASKVLYGDGTWKTAPTGGGAAQLLERGAYAQSTAYAIADVFTYQGARYAVATAFTGGSTPDFSKTIALGVDPASTAQVVISSDGTAAGFRTTVAGEPGILPLAVGTFVPDDEDPDPDPDPDPGAGADWQTYATNRWLRSGLPNSGTAIDAATWTAAAGGHDLGGHAIGQGFVTTDAAYHGVKHLFGESVELGVALGSPLSSSPGQGPAAMLARFARLGPLTPANGTTCFFFHGGGIRLAVQYTGSRPTGQKLNWAVFPDVGDAYARDTVGGLNQSGMAGGQSTQHLFVDIVIRVVLDGVNSKLYANGILQFEFDASGQADSAVFNLNNYDGGDSTFRGLWVLSDVILFPANATPARVAAAEATIPAGA